MQKIGYLCGRLRRIYVGIWRDYRDYKLRRYLIYAMSKDLSFFGYFLVGNKLVKYHARSQSAEEGAAKRIALRTNSHIVEFKDGNVYLYPRYRYLNWKHILYYLVYPLITIIGAIIWAM